VEQFNIGYICSTEQVIKGNGDQPAIKVIHTDGSNQEYTFKDLDVLSNKIANCFSSLGFNKGDIIFTLLGRSIEQTYSLLGSLKMQLITGTLFTNFGEEALYDRLLDSGAKGIITQKKQLNKIQLICDKLPKLKIILVTDLNEHLNNKILSLGKLLNENPETYITPVTQPDSPSILHYTSGSTGKPKGVLHKHNSIVLQKLTSKDVLQLNENELFWCTADPGWVTGVSYGIIGPLSLGTKQIYYEGGYNPEKWLSILNNEGVTIWYTAPTALRMLMQESEDIFEGKQFNNLKYIFSVGEPLNPEVASWANEKFRKPVYDTYFQTETGSIMISNTPLLEIKPASMGLPIKYITADILNDEGSIVPNRTVGNLCIKSGWDSMFIDYLNNKDIYNKKFKNGYYFTGDKAFKDENGYFWFSGRTDDIINTGGHLVSPFEIESSLLEIPEIIDAAVIAAKDDLLFEKVVAFIKLREDFILDSNLELKIQLHVGNKVAPIAVPKEIVIRSNIPKNKSGKIMRRYLRSIYEGRDPGDISTLEE
jgi:acetyl-CoA synthetase